MEIKMVDAGHRVTAISSFRGIHEKYQKQPSGTTFTTSTFVIDTYELDNFLQHPLSYSKPMQLIRDLCKILINSNKPIKIIGIIAQSGDQDILSHEEENTLEIGLTKKTYLRIFKESHYVFHNHYEGRLNLDRLSRSELDELYYMTLGFLITTNEHSTIIALHEALVQRLKSHEYDLEIISCFLTCRMKRINKSSSLWHWLKKLTLIRINKGEDVDNLLQRALVSCKLHFANYYANNYLQWVITVCRSKRIGLSDFQEPLINLCRAHLLDSSIWRTLKIYFRLDEKLVDYMAEEYNRLTGSHLSKNVVWTNYDDVITNLFEWLLRLQCNYTTPFCMLIESTESLPTLNKLEEMLNHSNTEGISEIKAKLQNYKEYIGTI